MKDKDLVIFSTQNVTYRNDSLAIVGWSYIEYNGNLVKRVFDKESGAILEEIVHNGTETDPKMRASLSHQSALSLLFPLEESTDVLHVARTKTFSADTVEVDVLDEDGNIKYKNGKKILNDTILQYTFNLWKKKR